MADQRALRAFLELRDMPELQRRNQWAALDSDPAFQAAIEAAGKEAMGRTGEAATARGANAGATFGLNDEIGGALRSLVPGGEGYGSYTRRVRDENEAYATQFPAQTMGGELLGAGAASAVPIVGWVTGPARAARGANLVQKIGSAIGRGLVFGGADAAAQAFGRGEGGLMERADSAFRAAPAGAAFGAVLGPFGEALGYIAQKHGMGMARAVEANIRDIARKSGMSLEEILDRIKLGQPLAGMTESTRVAARALKDISPSQGQTMRAQAQTLAQGSRETAANAGIDALTGAPGMHTLPNYTQAATEALTENAAGAGSRLGNMRLGAGTAAGRLSDVALDQVQRNPDLFAGINRLARQQGRSPLLVTDEVGRITFARVPSVVETEGIRQLLGDTAHSLFTGKGGMVSTDLARGMESGKDAITEAAEAQVPGLSRARAASSDAIEARDEAFEAGQTFRTTPAEQFSIDYSKRGPDAQYATNLGAAVSLRNATGNKTAGTVIDEMMADALHGGDNFALMVGDDAAVQSLRGPLGPVTRAREDRFLLNELSGGSPTAARQEAIATLRRGGAGGRFELPSEMPSLYGDGLRILRHVISDVGEFTDDELQGMAKYLMSTDPDLMRKVLGGDNAARNTMRQLANRFLEAPSGNRMSAAAAGTLAQRRDPRDDMQGVIDMMMGAP